MVVLYRMDIFLTSMVEQLMGCFQEEQNTLIL